VVSQRKGQMLVAHTDATVIPPPPPPPPPPQNFSAPTPPPSLSPLSSGPHPQHESEATAERQYGGSLSTATAREGSI